MEITKLTREQEIAFLPEILRERINILRLDESFEPKEGTEVRSCMLAVMIYDNHQPGESFLETGSRVVKTQKAPEKISLSADNFVFAVEMAECMQRDANNGIDLYAPDPDKYYESEVIGKKCSAVAEYASIGLTAQPRKRFIKQYLKEKEVVLQ